MSLKQSLEDKLKQIKLVVFDVDGVLTDGKLYYSADGETNKVFHVRDGVGLKLLGDMGISVAVITAKNSPMVASRMRELGIEHYFAGVKDKKSQVEALSTALSIPLASIAFVGDDMVDVPAMQLVAVSISPSDAYEYVRDGVDYVAPVAGGMGVARHVCDLILRAQGLYQEAYQKSMSAEFERKRH